MNTRKSLILALSMLAILSMSIAIGCRKESVSPATGNIPEGVTLLGRVKLQEILEDPDIETIANKVLEASGEPQTFDEALASFVLETGIDLRGFTEFLVFGDPFRQEADGDYLGVILKGDMEENRLLEGIEKEEGIFTTSDYKGVEVHISEDGETAVTFLDDGSTVIGSQTMVQDVIDVSKGDKRAIRGRVLDTFNSLGDALVTVALEVPPEALEELSSETPDFGISLEIFSGLEMVAITLDKRGENISAEVQLGFAEEETAADAAEGIGGLLSFIKLFIDNQDIAQLIDSIEVDALRTEVTLSLKITITEILNLIETFEGF
ncbi:MAG: hypothetical protein V3U90_07370 [Dehalococcoidia bacterium]